MSALLVRESWREFVNTSAIALRGKLLFVYNVGKALRSFGNGKLCAHLCSELEMAVALGKVKLVQVEAGKDNGPGPWAKVPLTKFL